MIRRAKSTSGTVFRFQREGLEPEGSSAASAVSSAATALSYWGSASLSLSASVRATCSASKLDELQLVSPPRTAGMLLPLMLTTSVANIKGLTGKVISIFCWGRSNQGKIMAST